MKHRIMALGLAALLGGVGATFVAATPVNAQGGPRPRVGRAAKASKPPVRVTGVQVHSGAGLVAGGGSVVPAAAGGSGGRGSIGVARGSFRAGPTGGAGRGADLPPAAGPPLWGAAPATARATSVLPGATVTLDRGGSLTAPATALGRRAAAPPRRPAALLPPTSPPGRPPVAGYGVPGRNGGRVYNHPVWDGNVRITEMRSINQDVLREMPAGRSIYRNGHWVRYNGKGQPVRPHAATKNGGRPTGAAHETHVPLPGPTSRTRGRG